MCASSSRLLRPPAWRACRRERPGPLIIREAAPSGRRTVFQPNSREGLLVFAAEQINGSSHRPPPLSRLFRAQRHGKIRGPARGRVSQAGVSAFALITTVAAGVRSEYGPSRHLFARLEYSKSGSPSQGVRRTSRMPKERKRAASSGALDYAGLVATGRNLIAARMPSTTKIAMTISCATTKGGSDCVGASRLRKGTFSNACTTPTKTFR